MAKEEKIKLTDISVPKGWKYLPFGEVFEFIQSNALSREQLTFDEHEGEIFNIHYGDIHSTYKTDLLDLDKEEKVPRIKNILVSKTLSFLKDGDLVIADASEDYEGVAANLEIKNIKAKKVTGGLHTFVARDNSGLTVKGFRTYVLKNPAITTELKKLATGSKVYGISKTNLATLKILLPPEKEQIKIAKILSTWDNNIETLEQLVAKKEINKKALMQQLLKGKKRFKEFKGKKWEEIKLEDCIKLTSGKTKPVGIELIQNSISIHPVYGGNGIIGYTSQNLLDGENIIIGRVGEYCGITRYIKGKCWITDNALYITQVYKEIDFQFLTLLLQHFDLSKLRNKGGQPLISQQPIYQLIFSLPEVKEQIKIASVISAADEEIHALKAHLEHYKQQKQGLMQLLLTGQKRVKV